MNRATLVRRAERVLAGRGGAGDSLFLILSMGGNEETVCWKYHPDSPGCELISSKQLKKILKRKKKWKNKHITEQYVGRMGTPYTDHLKLSTTDLEKGEKNEQ